MDEVLLPAAFREPGIIESAEEAGYLEILLDAVESAGLTTTLQFLGPFILFASSDQAFTELEIETVESLTKEQLTGCTNISRFGRRSPFQCARG